MKRDKEFEKQYGIPKFLRQYAKRYAGLDAYGIMQVHRKAKDVHTSRGAAK